MTQRIQSRSVGQLLPSAILTLAGACVLAVASIAWLPSNTAQAQISNTTPILEIYDPILTNYGAEVTGVNFHSPQHMQRGTYIDGSLRVPLQNYAIAGNPFAHARPGSGNSLGIDLATGNFDGASATDLRLPTMGPAWTIGRRYNSAQVDTNGHHDSESLQGWNWSQDSTPEGVLYSPNAQDDAEDVYYLVYGANAFLEFKRESTGSDYFKGKDGATGVVVYRAASSPNSDTYTYYDRNGNEMWLYGDSESWGCSGQIWKHVDAAGNTSHAGNGVTNDQYGDAASSNYAAYKEGYDSTNDERLVLATDANDRRFTYSYNYIPRLSSVVVDKPDGSGGWNEIARVTYNYYSATSDHGLEGDLAQVAVKKQLEDASTFVVRRTSFRYYKDSNGDGHAHALKLVVGAEGVRQADLVDNSSVANWHLGVGTSGATDAELKPYASAFFKYTDHQISEVWLQGDCGCSGGENGTHKIQYDDNEAHSDTTGYNGGWASRTIVERPDGSFLTQYFDETGQPGSYVITDADPATGSPDTWVHGVTRNSDGIVTSLHTPANNTTYTHSSGLIEFSTTVGLVTSFDLVTATTGTKHFASDQFWRTGTGGSKFYEQSWDYDEEWLEFGSSGNHNVRPLIAEFHTYEDATSPPTTPTPTTHEFDYTFHTGTLTLKEQTTTLPAISTARNGAGGTGNVVKTHYTDTERVDYELSATGIVTYRAYNTVGQTQETVVDADTSSLTSPPYTSTAGALDRATTYKYDSLGRLTETVHPDLRTEKVLHTRLAKARPVTLRYAHYKASPETYYGPLSYLEQNHAGNPLASATVGLDDGGTLDETDIAQSSHIVTTATDLLAALANFTDAEVTSLTTYDYDATGGRLTSTQTYHDIPSSGAGSNSTNYVQTTYQYDEMGRTIKTVERAGTTSPSHATIYATVYDGIGRFSSRQIGTDDGSPGDMVTTEEVEYDGGNDGGNSWVTKRTAFVQDSSTDSRVTEYIHDVRGNVLFEERPETPHNFHEYDNEQRRIATGLYSAAFTPGTTETPSNRATNRVGLSKTNYDELGRTYKETWHKISSTGADTDHIGTEYWYDKNGNVVKERGAHLVKYEYDRLDRPTKTYTLSTDGGLTSYAAAIVISDDDVVLVQDAVVYADNTNDVIATATIERWPGDGTAGTEGPLDANQDGDDVAFTNTDMDGRPQFTALWYNFRHQLIAECKIGTYGDATFDRLDSAFDTPPTRDDDHLVTEYSYDKAGRMSSIVDPMNLEQRRTYDDAGQLTQLVRNYDSGTTGPSGSDVNRTTNYVYENGLLKTSTEDMPSPQTDQVTTYTYGTTKGSSSPNSRIATGHLLESIAYPAADGDVSMAYNAQGEVVWRENQAGIEFDLTLDDAGRLTKVEPTLPSGSDFDDKVAEIRWAYADRGTIETITQYDDQESVLDQVKHEVNDFGQLEHLDQDHDSLVGSASGRAKYRVTHEHELLTRAGRPVLRPSKVVLPSAAEHNFFYASTGGSHDDLVGRISEIRVDNDEIMARYTYLGLDTIASMRHVGTEDPDPSIDIGGALVASSSDHNLDRFNRFSKLVYDRGESAEFVDLDYEYNRNSQLVWQEDNVHDGLDIKYTVDGLNRTEKQEFGTRSGSSITSMTREQAFTFNHMGTWASNKISYAGIFGTYTGTDEARTFDADNELNDRDYGATTVDLTHDAVHSLLDDGEEHKFEYDAFNRVRRILDQSDNEIAEFEYNGLNWRIKERYDWNNNNDVDDESWHHNVYDMHGRLVAVYYDDDTDAYPKEELLRGPSMASTGSGGGDSGFKAPSMNGVPHGIANSGEGGSTKKDDPNKDKTGGSAGGSGGGSGASPNGFVSPQTPDSGWHDLIIGPPIAVAKDADPDAGWAEPSSGVDDYDKHIWTDPFGDPIVITSGSGKLLEGMRYSPAGEPFCMLACDMDANGVLDVNDYNALGALLDPPTYVRWADYDLDGDVDGDDQAAVGALLGGSPYTSPVTMGWGKLSNNCNMFGAGGSQMLHDDADELFWAAGAGGNALTSPGAGIVLSTVVSWAPFVVPLLTTPCPASVLALIERALETASKLHARAQRLMKDATNAFGRGDPAAAGHAVAQAANLYATKAAALDKAAAAMSKCPGQFPGGTREGVRDEARLARLTSANAHSKSGDADRLYNFLVDVEMAEARAYIGFGATGTALIATGGYAIAGAGGTAAGGGTVTAADIVGINQGIAGGVELTGSAQTVIANMFYRQGAARAASAIRDIAGRHLFADGNKRTAQAVAERLLGGSVGAERIREVVTATATGALRTVEAITAALLK